MVNYSGGSIDNCSSAGAYRILYAVVMHAGIPFVTRSTEKKHDSIHRMTSMAE